MTPTQAMTNEKIPLGAGTERTGEINQPVFTSSAEQSGTKYPASSRPKVGRPPVKWKGAEPAAPENGTFKPEVPDRTPIANGRIRAFFSSSLPPSLFELWQTGCGLAGGRHQISRTR